MEDVKINDFLNWILEQPRDRPVDMRAMYFDDPCGCLGVQYAKEKWPQKFEESPEGVVGAHAIWFKYGEPPVIIQNLGKFTSYLSFKSFGEFQDLIESLGRDHFTNEL